MAAALLRTVILDDGTVVEAGTEATAALRKKIANPVAWEGEDSKSEPATS